MAKGLAAAPKGFEESGPGLGGRAFVGDGEAGPGPVEGEFEFDENLELMLDIHEFLLVGNATFGSLEPFEVLELCDSVFSVLCRRAR